MSSTPVSHLQISHHTVTFTSFSKRYAGHGLPKLDPNKGPNPDPDDEEMPAFGALIVYFKVEFPKRLTDRHYEVLKSVLGKEEVALLEGLVRLLNHVDDVPIGVEEYRFCDQCWFDASGSPDWCMPAPPFFSWWAATVALRK